MYELEVTNIFYCGLFDHAEESEGVQLHDAYVTDCMKKKVIPKCTETFGR